MFKDFLQLLFPKACLGCENILVDTEQFICIACEHSLPILDEKDDSLAKKLVGRVHLLNSYGFLAFNKKGIAQKLLHELKYNANPDLGSYLGKSFANHLHSRNGSLVADFLIPIPLYPKRQKERGYNQSEMIARGISQVYEIPVETNVLVKAKETASQTRKGRLARLENIQEGFQLANAEKITNKRLILVDDVATTGATLEACCNCLEKAKPQSISIMALAVKK